jgi:proton-dependent oligopeptide transporter, POT family
MPFNPFASPKKVSNAAEHAGGYRTAPLDIPGMPPGIPFIVGNEAAERFSFYGMRAILVVFMMHHIRDAAGQLATVSEPQAREYYHLFVFAAYFFPFFGALLSDGLLGKYRTIIWLSIVYCLGHLALALDDTWRGLLTGLALIAIGSGGIKPCVSAHVGDQFSSRNQHLLEKVFGWFYLSINFGSFISTLLIPALLEEYGPNVAFGVPGLLMLTATVVFWAGRYRYAHVPAGGLSFVREAVSPAGLKIVARLTALYVFVAVFWALYDQSGSAWVQQAEQMDRNLLGERLGNWLGVELVLLPAQVQAVNPLLILLFIPLFSYVIFPAAERVVRLTPLRKIGCGFVLTSLSFLVSAWIEAGIAAGNTPSVWWQILAYVLITAAEVMVSVVGLEFSYTQAPRTMKSVVMALWYLSVSIGNLFASQVNRVLQDSEGKLVISEVRYYLFFAGLMALATIVYAFYALTYREQTFLQESSRE